MYSNQPPFAIKKTFLGCCVTGTRWNSLYPLLTITIWRWDDMLLVFSFAITCWLVIFSISSYKWQPFVCLFGKYLLRSCDHFYFIIRLYSLLLSSLCFGILIPLLIKQCASCLCTKLPVCYTEASLKKTKQLIYPWGLVIKCLVPHFFIFKEPC